MPNKSETWKEIAKTLTILVLMLSLLYSQGIYERTLIIKNAEIKHFLIPPSEKWNQEMQDLQLGSFFSGLRSFFSKLIPRSEIEEKVEKEPTKIFHSDSPLRILLVGDSMALFLNYSFTKEFQKQEYLDFRIVGKSATSLSVPEYFDWPKHLKTVLELHTYDLILIHLGANDAQSIRDSKNIYKMGTPEWKTIYSYRLREMITIAKQNQAQVYWIGLPPMQNAFFNQEVKLLNELAESICKEENIRFFSTWDILGDNEGNYTKIKSYKGRPVLIRTEDGIHVNLNGTHLIRDKILESIQSEFQFSKEIENK